MSLLANCLVQEYYGKVVGNDNTCDIGGIQLNGKMLWGVFWGVMVGGYG